METLADVQRLSYSSHESVTENGITNLVVGNQKIRLQIFGDHNLQNIWGTVGLLQIGADRRLEELAEPENCVVFNGFAHSPSKLKATTEAVKNNFRSENWSLASNCTLSVR